MWSQVVLFSSEELSDEEHRSAALSRFNLSVKPGLQVQTDPAHQGLPAVDAYAGQHGAEGVLTKLCTLSFAYVAVARLFCTA